MAEKSGAITISILLWIFGTLIAIVILVGVVWPFVLNLWYGDCWSEARADVRGLGKEIEGSIRYQNSQEVNYRLNLQNCIAGVMFVNGYDNPNSPDGINNLLETECSDYDGFKSYMIMIPADYASALNGNDFPAEFEDKLDSFQDSLTIWKKIKVWATGTIGKNPPAYCYELKHDFSAGSAKSLPDVFWTDSWIDPTNRNSGDNYCVRVSPKPIGDSFNYHIEEIPCIRDSGGGW